MEFLQFTQFKNNVHLKHGISTRNNGCSSEKYSTLNLSYNTGDKHEIVQNNRNKIAGEFGIEPGALFFPEQKHTNIVSCLHSSQENKLSATDALITNLKDIALGVLAADCVPILFHDSKRQIIAAAHAGWRGTVKRIVVNVIQKMQSEYSSSLKDIKIGIGPSIQKENYEVGSEVLEEFQKLDSVFVEKYAKPSSNSGHGYLDLQGINKKLLIDYGIQEANIELMRICTFANPKLFFSARRDGFNSGRFGSIIMLT